MDTLAGIVYLAPYPHIGPIMQAIGTLFTLDLLTSLTSRGDTTAIDDHLQTFSNPCFNDPEAIPWETRFLWQGDIFLEPIIHA